MSPVVPNQHLPPTTPLPASHTLLLHHKELDTGKQLHGEIKIRLH